MDEKGTEKNTPVPLAKGLHKRHQLSNLIYLEMNYNQFNFTFRNSSDQHFIRTFAKNLDSVCRSIVDCRSSAGRQFIDSGPTVETMASTEVKFSVNFRASFVNEDCGTIVLRWTKRLSLANMKHIFYFPPSAAVLKVHFPHPSQVKCMFFDILLCSFQCFDCVGTDKKEWFSPDCEVLHPNGDVRHWNITSSVKSCK